MQVAIGLYPGFTALDALGPYQVFVYAPDTDVVFVAPEPGRITDDRGRLHVDVEHAFSDVPSPDVVLVPGGLGYRAAAAPDGPYVRWVRQAHEQSRYTASVCTGALILGAAGLLDGLSATTHWCYTDELAAHGATMTERRVVFEDRIVTGAGVSAGIDLAFALLGRLEGDLTAQAVQLSIEYDPQPPYDTGSPSKAGPELRDLVRGVIDARRRAAAY
jgi:transcriptional regulator GlxA family with amidase domain